MLPTLTETVREKLILDHTDQNILDQYDQKIFWTTMIKKCWITLIKKMLDHTLIQEI